MNAPDEKNVSITVQGTQVVCTPDKLGQKRRGAISWTFHGGGAKWVAVLPEGGPFSEKYLGNMTTPPRLKTKLSASAEVGSKWKYAVLVQLEQGVLAVDPEIIVDPDE